MMKIADDLPDTDYDMPMAEGRCWEISGGDALYNPVSRPIGFMRTKPRVRVKAWTMPIIPDEPK